jgi:outer membrane protein OmpA-like peptidoglycan-associated protein
VTTDTSDGEATGEALTPTVEPDAPAAAADTMTEDGVESTVPAEETATPTEGATDTAPEAVVTDTDSAAAEAPVAEADIQAGAEVEAGAPAAAAGEDAQPSDVTENTIGTDVRTSTEEFQTAIDAAPTAVDATATSDSGDSGLTNLEKALFVGLGAVAVGSLLSDGSTVVANTGDRVVVDRNGRLVVYKDDDALLFREGTNVRTETFSDGSARTFHLREDGSQIVTIRDAEGRVLRRTRVAQDGTELRLFDDTVQAEAIDMAALGNYTRADSISFSTSDEAALRTALQADIEADRRFSLRQIRDYEEVRSLVPSIDLDTINFATGSAAIPAGQIDGLVSVGTTMEEMLTANPREIFLIEGHTDAVGDASSNLALSDRRAESVALALTESFENPPENLVVQGYGDQYLKVETDSAEQANRRATIRRITPLLTAAAD